MVTRFAGAGLDIATMNVGSKAIPVPPVGNQKETDASSMTR